MPPRSADARLRAALLMPLAVLLVHQGRYYRAFGGHTRSRLLRDGHAYLGSVVPYAVLAAALALGVFAGRMARAWQGIGPAGSERADSAARRRSHSTLRIWGLIVVLLLGIYCVQELTEGALAAGHAGGLAGIVGSGGWLAVPLALIIGGLLTLLLGAGDALVRLLARLRARRSPPADTAPLRVRPLRRRDWRLSGPPGIGAGRAPPYVLAHR